MKLHLDDRASYRYHNGNLYPLRLLLQDLADRLETDIELYDATGIMVEEFHGDPSNIPLIGGGQGREPVWR